MKDRKVNPMFGNYIEMLHNFKKIYKKNNEHLKKGEFEKVEISKPEDYLIDIDSQTQEKRKELVDIANKIRIIEDEDENSKKEEDINLVLL